MGNSSGKVILVEPTSSTSAVITTLVNLVKLAETLPSLDYKARAGVTVTVNLFMGFNPTIQEVIAKQLEIAKEIETSVNEARQQITSEVRNHAKVVARFNDGDGDDIEFRMEDGISRVLVNGQEFAVKINRAAPPVLEFEYTDPTSSSRWIWEVDFETRSCTGRRPRVLRDKILRCVLMNDSVMRLNSDA
jgi:hypothetical protein